MNEQPERANEAQAGQTLAAAHGSVRCPKCSKALIPKKYVLMFQCQCFTYTLPIRDGGTYIKDGQVCKVRYDG